MAAVRGPEAALGAFNGSRHPGSRESAGDSGRSERGGNGSMALLLAGLGVVALAAARAPRRQ